MKGFLPGEQFDAIVYGSQTAFIKTFPTFGQVVIHAEAGEILPYKVNAQGSPGQVLKPHFTVGEQFYIKEPWRIASILSCDKHPDLDGHKTIVYNNDLSPVQSGGQIFNNINTLLFKERLQMDETIPGIKMKATNQYSDAAMPCWAARYGLHINAARFVNLRQLTLQELRYGTGKEDLTNDQFIDLWDHTAKRGHQWAQNPIIGYYEFSITQLNGYDGTTLD